MAKRVIKVRCIETGEVYNGYNEAGRATGISHTSIRLAALGKLESTKGLHFEVVEEDAQEEEELTPTVQNEQELGVVPVTVTNEQGETVPVIDSREVARMMGKSHAEVLRYIEGDKNSGIISIAECLVKAGASLSGYFIESSYLNTINNRKHRCYLVTKKGCELLGNKQQGEKGILFSIAYVERFNEMEKELKEKQQPKQMSDDEIIAKALFLLNGKYEQAIAELTQAKSELTEKTGFIDDINDCFTFTKVKQYNKQLLRDRKDIVLSTAKLNEVAAELGIPVNKIDNPIEYSPYRRVNAYPRKVWMTAYPDIKLPEKESK